MKNEKSQLSMELDKWLTKKENRGSVHFPKGYRRWKQKFDRETRTPEGFQRWLKSAPQGYNRNGGNLRDGQNKPAPAGRPGEHRIPNSGASIKKGRASEIQKRILQLQEIRKGLQSS